MSIPSPASFPDSPLSRAISQPLMLGLFLPIQSGGWSMSTLPRTTDWTFDYNARLTLKAEALGFDLVFGLAQWLGKDGHGGAMRYRRESLDSFITIASLASITKRILLVSTLHILYGNLNPLHLAKFGATLDHISGGRWGLNMVTGHSIDEAEMFGREGHFEHDQRYEMASEFVDVMEQLWSLDENLSFAGQWYRTRNAFVSPKPRYGRPVLVNATSSPAGIDYAAKHSDLIFITSSAGAQIDAALEVLPAHTAQVRERAQAYGRQVRTLINPTIVCRPTEREALAYHDAILSHADFGAVDGFTGRRSDAKAWKGHQREQRVLGGNIQIIGSPERVVDDLLRLKAAGIDGAQLTFFDFEPDLAYFGEAVLPLLEQAGLRVRVPTTA
ncbi:MAG TPA: LLM class flavin-dependent oxidoreductase [Paraburkholderia sp.]|nr:LLM class flavin-dependent oxidoreductase [Paraburkholderia sp.]